MEKSNVAQIPFIKAVRVGNFKLWRGKHVTKAGKEKLSVDSIYVSSLDGTWMVRVPSTQPMYSLICDAYGDDKSREDFLRMLFVNYYNITTNTSVALHDALYFLTEMLTFPYLLLSEKEMCSRMDRNMKAHKVGKSERKEYVGKMKEYRRRVYELIAEKKSDFLADYERRQHLIGDYERDGEEEDLRRDGIAEQAMEILSEE